MFLQFIKGLTIQQVSYISILLLMALPLYLVWEILQNNSRLKALILPEKTYYVNGCILEQLEPEDYFEPPYRLNYSNDNGFHIGIDIWSKPTLEQTKKQCDLLKIRIKIM